MWEWLAQKATELVRLRYKSETVRGMTRDDVVQEVMIYLFEHKDYAEKIYEQKCVGMIYRTVINIIYQLKAKEMNLETSDSSRLSIIYQKCEEYGIEPVPQNAYKIAAIIHSTMSISACNRTRAWSIPNIMRLLQIGKECAENTYVKNTCVSFNDEIVAGDARTQLNQLYSSL